MSAMPSFETIVANLRAASDDMGVLGDGHSADGSEGEDAAGEQDWNTAVTQALPETAHLQISARKEFRPSAATRRA
jgi:hypothetical protein